MGWGFAGGNRPPETAKTVAKAFYAGKVCKRGNCQTDGMLYWLENSVIARRIALDEIPEAVAAALSGEPWARRELEFSFAGWPTKMTARHLSALGVDADCHGIKNPSPRFNDIEVGSSRWYTLAEIAELRPPPVVVKVPRQPRFVNMTAELFPA